MNGPISVRRYTVKGIIVYIGEAFVYLLAISLSRKVYETFLQLTSSRVQLNQV
jgi:hypothetical protein